MPTVSSATTGNSLANLTYSQTANAPTPSQSLGEADFLKLLSIQFQQQDPMKPMDDTAFIAQTAQFTSLQQMTQLNQQQQMMAGAGFIGRNATVEDTSGNLVTGLVTALDNSGSAPAVVVNGVSYPLTAIKRVEAAPAATTPSTTTTPAATTAG